MCAFRRFHPHVYDIQQVLLFLLHTPQAPPRLARRTDLSAQGVRRRVGGFRPALQRAFFIFLGFVCYLFQHLFRAGH